MSLPPLNVSALLREHGLRPKKGLGQNFLVDTGALEKIAAAAEISPQSAVLEIGPGVGSLTRVLAQAAGRVVAVELDSALIPILEAVLAPWPNVRLVQGDILDLDPAALMPSVGYLVAANLPYYITSAVIRHLLEAQVKPARMVLTVQQEVAQRICAKPGKDNSLLSLSVQVYGTPFIAARIPAGAFWPAPQVDSAAVRIDLLEKPRIPPHLLDEFFRLAKAGFSQKRKTLRNALTGGMGLPADESAALLAAAGIDPQRRAETLSLDEWASLAETAQSRR